MNTRPQLGGFVALLLVGLLGACGKSEGEAGSSATTPAAPAAATELTVYAAASLREACTELGAAYERKHGTKLVFNFGASNALAQQIVASGKGDVFISADEAQMNVVDQAKLLVTETRSKLLSNQLVVVQPKPRPASVPVISSAEVLADEAIARLSLANPEAVPAGKYAKAWLAQKDLWAKVEARVVPGVDVRAALGAVESGAAQAGIVYATDAAISDKVEVVLLVPLDEGPKISYPVAALACAADAGRARTFVNFLHGVTARSVFERHGFIVLPSARSGIDGY